MRYHRLRQAMEGQAPRARIPKNETQESAKTTPKRKVKAAAGAKMKKLTNLENDSEDNEDDEDIPLAKRRKARVKPEDDADYVEEKAKKEESEDEFQTVETTLVKVEEMEPRVKTEQAEPQVKVERPSRSKQSVQRVKEEPKDVKAIEPFPIKNEHGGEYCYDRRTRRSVKVEPISLEIDDEEKWAPVKSEYAGQKVQIVA